MPTPPSELTRWFSEEIQPHEPKLRAWLRARFPQLGDHDDLVQDTYLRLWRARGSGKIDHPKAYLYTTARNAALDQCRRKRVLTFERLAEADTSNVYEDQRPAPADASDRDLELSTLIDATSALPARCREILILRKHEGLSHREIADRLGISTHTVNAQLTAAMLKCRAYFQRHGLLEMKKRATESDQPR